MSTNAAIARPYAQAIFEIARDENSFADWGERLDAISVVCEDDAMLELIGHPRVTSANIVELIVGVTGLTETPAVINFVKLLAHNKRLPIVSSIAVQYQQLRAEAEKTIEAELESAMDVDEEQQRQLTDALEQRLGRSVTLKIITNDSLLGGAVVRAGDLVIDGSVKTKLRKLAGVLNR